MVTAYRHIHSHKLGKQYFKKELLISIPKHIKLREDAKFIAWKWNTFAH